MRKIFFLTLSLSLVACSDSSTQKQTKEEKITKTEVKEVFQKWADAMLDNDPRPLQIILDETWLYSGSDDGTTTNKRKAMEGFSPGESTLKDIILNDTIIRTYGNMAIVTGKEKLIFVEEKDTNRVFLRFTDVFLKKEGVVRAISTHSSPFAVSKEE